ncbi:MAG: type I-MYXAN CRISPR-associated protein Cas6/Cmx6 [Betaproteobacteria bacterium]|nr:type I-MYXAN CRISPR-associated protein Cas6/Cmx6 [Betaproteobacteria bacterium]
MVLHVGCHSVPEDHGHALYLALLAHAPWLAEEAEAGVLPLQGGSPIGGEILLGRRARLTLRVPRFRAADVLALEGAELGVGSGLRVGAGALRELAPFPSLYSSFVASASQDEAEFERSVAGMLEARGLSCGLICSRFQWRQGPGGAIPGFGLLLYGLSIEQSLAVQSAGVGEGRTLGWGVFVPHKRVKFEEG